MDVNVNVTSDVRQKKFRYPDIHVFCTSGYTDIFNVVCKERASIQTAVNGWPLEVTHARSSPTDYGKKATERTVNARLQYDRPLVRKRRHRKREIFSALGVEYNINYFYLSRSGANSI
uniref:Uncharacterized protein n=1 Tax=Romanomermis culicivorax TaxID=13658 RepID=A0A915KSY2_ROMCU